MGVGGGEDDVRGKAPDRHYALSGAQDACSTVATNSVERRS